MHDALGNVWHPYAQMQFFRDKPPLKLSSAKGYTLTDASGTTYLDTIGGLWNVSVGYGREDLAREAYLQLQRLSYVNLCNFTHEPAQQLATALSERLPAGLNKTFFCNSGAEATETAIKIARQFHRLNGHIGRYKVIAFRNGYHGTTLGALSATGTSRDKIRFEPLLPGFLHVGRPRLPSNDAALKSVYSLALKELEECVISEGPETIASLIMELVPGVGGVHVPPQEFVAGIREICDRFGILLIFDEVVTGMGRTGKWFGLDHFGVAADIVTLAKGITSGYLPLGAVVACEAVFDRFLSDKREHALLHGFTASGNPACCAVAVKVMEILEEEDLISNAEIMGAKLKSQLSVLMETHSCIRDVRGIGLMIGIEFCRPDDKGADLDRDRMTSILTACLEQGVIIRTLGSFPNVMALMPPLCIDRAFCDRVTQVLDSCLRKAELDFRKSNVAKA